MKPFKEQCPITHRPFFMYMDHPELGSIPTYGGPFDSYSIPHVDEDGCLRCERYDHDRGEWMEGGECMAVYLTTAQPNDIHLPTWIERSTAREIHSEIALCYHGSAYNPSNGQGIMMEDEPHIDESLHEILPKGGYVIDIVAWRKGR